MWNIAKLRQHSCSALPLMLVLLFAMSFSAVDAKPFVWARTGDPLTLGPHAVNEGTTHAFNHQIYEPLIIRNRSGTLEPALATSWRQDIDPLTWTFKLRKGVLFHDGKPLTSQDVHFSLQRALAKTSDLRTRLQGVKSFKTLGPHSIQITTYVRDPLLPIRLTDIFVMSEAWAREHDVVAPQNYLSGVATFASDHANGTGPYQLVSRVAGKETRLKRNDQYWGWNGDDLSKRIAEIAYRPIPDDKQRITALLDGSVDFVQDVPLSELEVLRQAPDLNLKSGPENRVIFLGLSVEAENRDGKPNPLQHLAVRKAISIAVDRLAIQREIMLGQSIPTGVLAPPGINGFPTELDNIPVRDLDSARKLLKDAAVAEGTGLTLDCPNNRYVNDAAICEAVVNQLAEIGLKITLQLRPKGPHFQKVRSGKSQMFLLGWGVPTFDSAYIFSNLFHTRRQNIGTWNGTGYSNSDLDERIVALSQKRENGDRTRSLSQIWFSSRDALVYVPIHVQTLIYAMAKSVNVEVDISNTPKLKQAIIKPAAAD